MTAIILVVFSYLSASEIQEALKQSGFLASALTSALDLFLLLALVFPANLTSGIALMAFSIERDQKTLEHLLSLPLTDNEIFLGKFLAALISGIAGLAMVFSVVIAYVVFSNPIVWNAPLFSSSLSILVFAACPMLVVFSALAATVLSRYVSSHDLYIANSVSISVVLAVYALKSVLNMNPLTFNLGLFATILVITIVMYILSDKSFNRERLLSCIIS